jgi:endonuclease-8
VPEGPEIRIAADKLADVLVGRKATQVQFAFDHLRKFEKVLTPLTITAVNTHGKAMLTCFGRHWVIYSHNQLYGRWYVTETGKTPDTHRQLRLTIATKQHTAWLYSASDIDVLTSESLAKHPFLAKLGPDILTGQLKAVDILDRLLAKPFRHRQLASLLLDQGFLAGLGTYLCAEILFFAGLHPKIQPAKCSLKQLKGLARLIIKISQRAYRTAGITNPPAQVKQLKAAGILAKEQHRFSVYGRAGQPCYQCNHLIQRSSMGGRPMFNCPVCQPLP